MSDALAALGIESWLRPGWLLGGALVALLAAGAAWRIRPAAADWPDQDAARAAGAARTDVLRGVGLLLRGAALLLLGAVLAGPVGVHRTPPEPGLGLDLVLVVDASGSMRALDAEVEGSWQTRLDLARRVVARFAERRAAEGDRVALVVFGESAFTQCPLTSDGALLRAALERVEAGMAGEATALGDALALAVKRAAGAAAAVASAPSPGKVAVLLTDGRHNAGALSVESAVALAVDAGLRVHTVAIGTRGEGVPMAPASGRAAGAPRLERHDVDVETLEGIARATGGLFFRARRASDLEAVYAEIDAIERVERPLPARVERSDRPEPLLALAGLCLLGELTLVRSLWRRLP